jgi:hypothetical protein
MQTYKYYLPTGERLAIFYKNGIVTIIPCSKSDQFSKEKSKILYHFLCRSKSADTLHLKFEVQLNTQKEFLDWCNNNYKRMFAVFTPVKGRIVKVEKIKRKKLNSYSTIKISYLA